MKNLRRFAVVVASAVVGLSVVGTASSAAPTRVLKFTSTTTQFKAVGFDPNSNALPPVGSKYILNVTLFNKGKQFGKPSGARVGNVELDCTITSSVRDMCTGAAHLPDGYFVIAAATLLNSRPVTWYAITGGVSAYASSHGQIKVTDVPGTEGDKSNVVVTLYS